MRSRFLQYLVTFAKESHQNTCPLQKRRDSVENLLLIIQNALGFGSVSSRLQKRRSLLSCHTFERVMAHFWMSHGTQEYISFAKETCAVTHLEVCHGPFICVTRHKDTSLLSWHTGIRHIGCLWLVGSLKFQVLLQKSPIKETVFRKRDM